MNKISILLPTRGRPELCVRSVESLINTCRDINNFDVLLAVDSDDVENTHNIIESLRGKLNMHVYSYERQGYKGLHLYYNDLAIKSSGSCVMLWNDDTTMLSKDWDVNILDAHKDKFCVSSPNVVNMQDFANHHGGTWGVYPIIPRKWVDELKMMSAVPSVDSWIDMLVKSLQIESIHLTNVEVYHDRFDLTGNNRDETHADALKDRSQGFNHEPEIFENHYQKLLAYLKTLKNDIN